MLKAFSFVGHGKEQTEYKSRGASSGGIVKKVLFALIASAAALAITPAAMADSTFIYSFTWGGIVASGTLTGSSNGAGLFDISSGTISLTGADINGIGGFLLPNTDGNGDGTTTNTTLSGGGTYLQYDDLLSTTNSAPAIGGNNGGDALDGWGLIFNLNGSAISIWGNGPGNYSLFEANNITTNGNTIYNQAEYDGGSFNISLESSPSANDLTVTPEPGSWLLLGTGLLGLAVFLYRKATPARLKLHL
jgi:hypothetical protein